MAQVLDRAADRSHCPATERQTWYLAGLILESDGAEDLFEDWMDCDATLSSSIASALIDRLLEHK
jgi:hypothetical protein